MANLFANQAFDIRLNLNLIIKNQVSYSLLHNSTYNGISYPDVAEFNYLSSGVISKFVLGGTGFVIGAFPRGTVTGVLEYSPAGSGTPKWGIENISYPVSKILNAAMTVGTADDNTVIAAIMSGNDSIQMSSSADYVSGFAGHDFILGNGGNDTLLGDAGSDTIQGGEGNDSIYGGNGLDSLTGNNGSDVFVFDVKPNTTSNKDVITDFVSGQDDIGLAKAAFTAIGASFTSNEFLSSATAIKGGDSDDRIIYNTSTGVLYYDADGSGNGAAVQIATLTNKPALVFGDFILL